MPAPRPVVGPEVLHHGMPRGRQEGILPDPPGLHALSFMEMMMRKWMFHAFIFGLCALAPAAQADARLSLTPMAANCNQQQAGFFSMVAGNAREAVTINRTLSRRGFPPLAVTCTVHEDHGRNGAGWDQAGTGTVMARMTGEHMIRVNQFRGADKGRLIFVAETTGTIGQPLQIGAWTQTPASGIGDVTVAPDGTIWLAGRNGSVWNSADGRNFNRIDASGFARVAAAPDGSLWAVGGNGSLWHRANGSWVQTPASNMADVAVGPDGRLWLAGLNETIWNSTDGQNFTRVEASGFRRLAVGLDGTVWAVGTNGTLWRLDGGQWTQTPASDMGDVAAAGDGTVWLAGRNGTIWFTRDGTSFEQVEASGFESIAASPQNRVWAVGANGTLWHR